MEDIKKVAEPKPVYGFVYQSEEEKMWREFNRPFIDKLQSFTRMIRRNKMLAEVAMHSKK